MAWFKKSRKPIEAQAEKSARFQRGCGSSAPRCAQVIYNKDLATNLQVCPKCSHHFRLSAARAASTCCSTTASTRSTTRELASIDPLHFTDTKPYRQRLDGRPRRHGPAGCDRLGDAGCIDGRKVAVCAMEYGFIGGSMGVVVGEKITRGIERAIDERHRR